MGIQIESQVWEAGKATRCDACGKSIERSDGRVVLKVTGHPERTTCKGECADKVRAKDLGVDGRKYR